MIDKKLVDYINSEIKKGTPSKQIKSALVKAGWKPADVDNAMKSIKPLQTKKTEKVFTVRLGIVKGLLLVLIINFGIILMRSYFLINYSYSSQLSEIIAKSMLSSLLIFPITGAIFWFMGSLISFFISKFGFKKRGNLKNILYGFGVAQIPLILGPIGLFIFFTGNIGIFLWIFLGIFSTLLMIVLMVNTLVKYQKLEWKRSLVTVIIVEIVLIAISLGVTLLLSMLGVFSPSLIINSPSDIIGQGSWM